MHIEPIAAQPDFLGALSEARCWLGEVLSEFAAAEQAIGSLAQKIGLKTERGLLSNLQALRTTLSAAGGPCAKLEGRIGAWSAGRDFRHLLAHASLSVMANHKGQLFVVTRVCPLTPSDQTPDRVWTDEERAELAKFARHHGHSIVRRIQNITADPQLLAKLSGKGSG